jgi:P27 family predicted phage terminase small subunit
MKGRPPKSEAKHKESGTYRAHRHSTRLKTNPDDDLQPPEHFTPEQAAKWNEVVNHLKSFDILAEQDADSIATYVQSVILQRAMFIEMQRTGIHDGEKTSAAFRVYRDLENVIKPLREQFGFTPRARQSIHVKPKDTKKVDPILAILSKNKKAV